MTWRVVCVSGIVKLELKLGYLVIRGEKTTRINLSEIGVLMVESTTAAVTTGLLCELARRKIKVVFCDEKHNPFGELVNYYGTVDTSLRLKQQISWNLPTKQAVWASIVKAKIKAQASLLFQENHPEEAALLMRYHDEVEPGDPSNREGHAAKVYFNSLFGPDFSRDSGLPPNPALNYGYSILLSSFNKEIINSGFFTQLGIFHDNQFNPFNLASDLMEPYRPLMDALVARLGEGDLDLDRKHQLVNLLNQTVTIDSSQQRVSQAISIYCASIFRALNTRKPDLISHYTWTDSCA